VIKVINLTYPDASISYSRAKLWFVLRFSQVCRDHWME